MNTSRDWISFDTFGKVVALYYGIKVGRFCWRVMKENMDLRDELEAQKQKSATK